MEFALWLDSFCLLSRFLVFSWRFLSRFLLWRLCFLEYGDFDSDSLFALRLSLLHELDLSEAL